MSSIKLPRGAFIVLLASIAGLAACASRPPRTAAERQADASLQRRVEQALDDDPRIYARHIDVRVERNKVQLDGFVWSASDFRYAKSDAAAVTGVLSVANNMELMRGGMTGTSR